MVVAPETRSRSAGRVAVGVLAALATGVTFAADAVPLAVRSGLWGLVGGAWSDPVVFGMPVLLLALVATILNGRVSGWWLAAAGLAVQTVVGLLPAVSGGATDPSPSSRATVLVTMAGAGLALGGAVLAVGQVVRPARPVVGAALVTGLLLQASLPIARPDRVGGAEVDLVLWVTLAVVTVAALLAGGGGSPVTGRSVASRWGIPVVVAAVSGVVQMVRAWRDGSVAPLRDELADVPADWSWSAGLAILVAAVVTGYAWHMWRAAGVRWVLSAFVVGPAALYALGSVTGDGEPVTVLLVPAALLTVVVAFGLVRYADRLVPWDAVALLVVAGTFPLVPRLFDAGRYDAAHLALVLLCFGLVWAVGVARVAVRPDRDAAPVAGLLAFGFVALLLGAQLLLPLLLAGRWYESASRTWATPALAGGAALVVGGLFLVEHWRGWAAGPTGAADEPADPAGVSSPPSGPVTIEIER
ncbi:hypothetical protein ACTMSW_22365 [Micromonospora sp. BQ11]|uniref:hypothetical protein n=1 Tax=Micromonospora sp. BQ11 TaxID=3452212 RepID=UPI003F8C7E50